MAHLSESEAKALLQKVLSYSKADECQVTLNGGRTGNLRFARNAVSTSGAADTLSLGVQSSFGKKTGTATINEFDDASLEKVVRRAEDVARLAPENPEFMPAVSKQQFKPSAEFAAPTAAIVPTRAAAPAKADPAPAASGCGNSCACH